MEFDFSREECINLESSLQCEWLETNGLGGYASSTVPGCNTRKHHGLLVAPVPELSKRLVFLSKMEAAIAVRKQVFHLSTNQFPGSFYPTGHKYMERFRAAQYPMTLYRLGDILLRRSVLMVQGENTVLLRYELLNSDLPITLQLTPHLAFRGSDELTHENDAFNPQWTAAGAACRIQPYDGLPALYIDCSMNSDLVGTGEWLYNVEYFMERLRGFDYQEDLYAAGTFEMKLQAGSVFVLRASLNEPVTPVMDLWKQGLSTRQTEINRYRSEPLSIRALKAKASQFIIRPQGKCLTVISGYPWGEVNKRDAIIASIGLTLSCGRRKEMTDYILGFVANSNSGSLSEGEAIDLPLWFAWMLQKFLKATNDIRTVHEVLQPALIKSLTAIAEGKVKGCILHESTGLLELGPAMTWMDRVVNGEAVTPRAGMPVEVNALWYNSLCIVKDLCKETGLEFSADFESIITRIKANYAKTFWVSEGGYLADGVSAEGMDISIRPNQIIPVALEHSPLNSAQKRSILSCVSANLLTPVGLRTLSPGEHEYIGQCGGTQDERMRAGHRGTVWPWLIGLYCEAALSVTDNIRAEKTRLNHIFEPLFYAHIGKACIGSISEAFNGDPPHDFRGEFASAMSVAETIRAWNMLTKGSDV